MAPSKEGGLTFTDEASTSGPQKPGCRCIQIEGMLIFFLIGFLSCL
jgi:hypothetical protein